MINILSPEKCWRQVAKVEIKVLVYTIRGGGLAATPYSVY